MAVLIFFIGAQFGERLAQWRKIKDWIVPKAARTL